MLLSVTLAPLAWGFCDVVCVSYIANIDLSGVRGRLFACGPADATASQNPIFSCLIKSGLVLPFWHLLTHVVLEKRPCDREDFFLGEGENSLYKMPWINAGCDYMSRLPSVLNRRLIAIFRCESYG